MARRAGGRLQSQRSGGLQRRRLSPAWRPPWPGSSRGIETVPAHSTSSTVCGSDAWLERRLQAALDCRQQTAGRPVRSVSSANSALVNTITCISCDSPHLLDSSESRSQQVRLGSGWRPADRALALQLQSDPAAGWRDPAAVPDGIRSAPRPAAWVRPADPFPVASTFATDCYTAGGWVGGATGCGHDPPSAPSAGGHDGVGHRRAQHRPARLESQGPAAGREHVLAAGVMDQSRRAGAALAAAGRRVAGFRGTV